MSIKKNFQLVILWEDELRLAGIKIAELMKMNRRFSNVKKELTQKQKDEYFELGKLATRLCYIALNGIDSECAITISRKPVES